MTEPTTIRVYRGADGTFTLYDDDGATQAYLTGAGTWTRMVWNDAARRLTLEPGGPERQRSASTSPRSFRVRLLPEGVEQAVAYAGRRTEIVFPPGGAQPVPGERRD